MMHYYDGRDSHAETSTIAAADDSSLRQTDLQGWLLGVHGYRQDATSTSTSPPAPTPVQDLTTRGDTSSAGQTARNTRKERPESISSISSEDSVNLDDLISANFTVDMEQETDLPDLAELELDDSSEAFWNMDDVLGPFRLSSQPTASLPVVTTTPADSNRSSLSRNGDEIFGAGDAEFNTFMNSGRKNGASGEGEDDLDWSPESEQIVRQRPTPSRLTPTSMTLPKPRTFGPSTPDNIRRQRSGSISSENSLNSQSTITAGHMYGRYVGTPPSSLHPSESSSSSPSSRSHSRLSSYSTSNQGSSSALPRARTASNNMLQQSRSFTTQAPSSGNTSVPGPSSAGTGTSAGSDKIVRSASRIGSSIATSKLAKRASHIPSPASTRATIIPQRTKSTHPGILHDTPSARNSRASHIPSARATVYRLTTPDPARAGSRLGVRSTTPGPRNSLFGTPPASSNSGIPARPQTSLSTGRPSGLQTPSRVMSRIAKKT